MTTPRAAAVLAAPAPSAAGVTERIHPHDELPALKGWRAVPDILRSLGRFSFTDLSDALGRAFDGADPRPAPPVPSDPADRVTFNGLELPRRAFSDESRISAALVSVIDAARVSLDIAVYELTLSEIPDVLARAKARGVRVRIVIDESVTYPRKRGQQRSPEIQRLLDAGYEMRTLRGSNQYGIMHNKFMVADGKLLESGSFNWTKAADGLHLENVFFSEDAGRIAGFQRYWQYMWDQARPASDKPPGGEMGPEPKGAPPEAADRPIRFNGLELPAYAFAPRGTPEQWLIQAVGAARTSVDIAMFSFTSPRLRDALAAARERGVKVRLLFDARNAATLDAMKWFIDQGWDVRIRAGRDGRRGVLHDKFTVVDGAFVETGSYNWTENADKNNFENANYFDDAGTARDYGAAYERMWATAKSPTPEELASWARAGVNAGPAGPPASGRTDHPSSR